MDLKLFAKAVARFKWIALAGTIAAISLAALTTVTEAPAIYQADTQILVTQHGFPWGRTVLPTTTTTSGTSLRSPNAPTYADPGRLSELAQLYATLVDSNAIQHQVIKRPDNTDKLTANPIVAGPENTILPIVDITGLAPSPTVAMGISQGGASALKGYITRQQQKAGVPANQRIVLQEIETPLKATVAAGRKKTLPIAVFLVVLLATVGLILVLENLRPQLRLLSEAEGGGHPGDGYDIGVGRAARPGDDRYEPARERAAGA